MRKSFFAIILTFLFFALVACAHNSGNLSWSNLTPQGKAAFALSVYNTEFDNYVNAASLPDLTEEEKSILRVKKKLLIKMKAALVAYISYVRLSQAPPTEVEQQLLDILNQLIAQRRVK